MKTLFSLLLRGLVLFAGAVCAYLLAALVLGAAVVHADRDPDTEGIDVYLYSNGVHTDFVLPLQNEVYDWRDTVRLEDSADGGAAAQYVAIGWGDRDFYLHTQNWSDLRPATAIGAVSGLNGSLLHLTYLERPPPAGHHRAHMVLTAAEYERLVRQILPYFRIGADGRAIALHGAGYGGNDMFYEAEGRYHLFHTCNTWTNDRLKKSGLKAVVWTPFAYSLLAAYR
ncbi:MAG: TIGR02117 family protein [Conchiformibius sp.]|nr:TIGR02117 family protein [Conchiformibius sp.]